jgi:hypothetical protein
MLVRLDWSKGKGAGIDMLMDIEGARARNMALNCIRAHISVRIRTLLGGVGED